MRLLTDAPAVAAAFVPDAPADHWQRSENVSRLDSTLMDALGRAPIWTQDTPTGQSFWSTVVLLSHVDVSQFDALKTLLGHGYASVGPIASLALNGRNFHGHRGRPWVAASGNLHLSVSVPIRRDAENAGALLMLPGVAAVDAIHDASGGAIRPGIKWVNDVVVGHRKMGGILTATHTLGRRVEDAVWGIGINVGVAPDIAPTPFVPAATCLREEPGGEDVTVPRLFWALLAAIEARCGELARSGPAALFAAYRADSLVVGRAVRVWEESACVDTDPGRWPPPFAEGVVADISDDLSLGLEGQAHRVSKGRLAFRCRRQSGRDALVSSPP